MNIITGTQLNKVVYTDKSLQLSFIVS